MKIKVKIELARAYGGKEVRVKSEELIVNRWRRGRRSKMFFFLLIIWRTCDIIIVYANTKLHKK